MEYDYRTSIELKKILETKIEVYNYKIENFSVKGGDEEFKKLVDTATNFRNMLQKTNFELDRL